MFELMNRKVVQFIESGLALKIMERYNHVKKIAEETGPKVLTFGHLDAGFYLWLVCIAISIFVFVLELLINRVMLFLWAVRKISVKRSFFA